MTEITSSSIITLKNDILIRYEHNYKEGVVILINTNNGELWVGNKECGELISLLRANNKPLKNIYAELLSKYEECDIENVFNSINIVIEGLYKNNFLIKSES